MYILGTGTELFTFSNSSNFVRCVRVNMSLNVSNFFLCVCVVFYLFFYFI
jgi:hypothetical protein